MKIKFKRLTSLLLLVLMLAGTCVVDVPALAAGEPKPTSVALDHRGTVTLPLGQTLTLNATLSPAGAQSSLSWKSSKRKVATVSGGVVTPKKVGTTTITVTTGNKKKAKVKVKVIDPYKPASVHFEQSGVQTVEFLGQIQLSAKLYPETAQSTLKWKSSNKRIATVNANGVVTGKTPGTTTITVTTRNKKKAKIKVRVVDNPARPITTTPDYNLPYVIYVCKWSHTIAILARDENGEWTRVIRTFSTGIGRNTKNTDTGIFFLKRKEAWHKWGSGYSPFASKLSVGLYLHGPIYKRKNRNTIRPSYYNCIGTNCSSGCVRTTCGAAAWVYYNCDKGTQIIIAQNSRFSAPRPPKIGKKAKRDPSDPGTNYEILMTRFSVNPGSLTLDQGASQGLAPGNVSPANTSTTGFTYVTGNGAVASVSDTGVVTGVGPGSTEIYVIANDDYQCTVKVPVTVNATSAKMAEASEVAIPDEVITEAASDGAVFDESAFSFEAEPVNDEPAPAIVVDEPESSDGAENAEPDPADAEPLAEAEDAPAAEENSEA